MLGASNLIYPLLEASSLSKSADAERPCIWCIQTRLTGGTCKKTYSRSLYDLSTQCTSYCCSSFNKPFGLPLLLASCIVFGLPLHLVFRFSDPALALLSLSTTQIHFSRLSTHGCSPLPVAVLLLATTNSASDTA